MLWVDKYRPLSLAKLDYHDGLTERLQGLARDGDIPHLLIYGPSGAGKKTRITALLREMFGPGVEKRRLEHRTFKTPSNKTIELTTIASNYHIEMNAADAGIYDRLVVQVSLALTYGEIEIRLKLCISVAITLSRSLRSYFIPYT
jgi:replication factor C subunit 3/5